MGNRSAAACQREAAVADGRVSSHRSGDGGDGEITEQGKGRWVDNFKYRPGSSLPKRIWLSANDPADGEDGADVIVEVSPGVEDLLHLHGRGKLQAKKASLPPHLPLFTSCIWRSSRAVLSSQGANGDPNLGSQAPKTAKKKKLKQEPLVIQVPPGTTVRRKNGTVLGDLIQPGQR